MSKFPLFLHFPDWNVKRRMKLLHLIHLNAVFYISFLHFRLRSPSERILFDKRIYPILHLRETIEQKAALPSFFGGHENPPDERKEGDPMITYQDFFLFCTFIVALISLIYQIFRGKR